MLEFGLVCDFIQARDDFIQATLRPNLGVPMMSHPIIRRGPLGSFETPAPFSSAQLPLILRHCITRQGASQRESWI